MKTQISTNLLVKRFERSLPRRVNVVATFVAAWMLCSAAMVDAAVAIQETYRLHNGGQVADYGIATDEIWVRESGRMVLRAESTAGTSDVISRAESFRQTTGQEANLVLYPVGMPRADYTRRYLTRHVAVQLEPGANAQAIAASVGATSCTEVRGLTGWWLLEIPGVGGALAASQSLQGQPGVKFAEAQLAHQQQRRLVPNDPLFSSQWHLQNTGQTGGTVGVDVNVTDVWDTYTGSGVVIGIVDDGLEVSHPDLAPNVVAGLSYDWNGVDNDPSPDVTSDYHGTACAGCAAARGNNTLGVSGSAPEAGLAGLRLIAGPSTDADEAAAMLHENQAIHVKNNSWGPSDFGFIVSGPGPLGAAALQQSVITGRGGLGTILMWAGGNGLDNGDHANYDGWANSIHTIAVGACDDRGQQVFYSENGACLVVVAPSLNQGRPGITTTDLVSTNGYNDGTIPGEHADPDYTAEFSGTSAATPIAAGVVGLLLQSNPNLGWRDVQEVLIRSATRVSPLDPGWFTNAAGLYFNNRFGAGLINGEAAVQLAQGWVNLDVQTNLMMEAAGLGLPIADNSESGATYDFELSEGDLRVEHVTLTVSIQHPNRGDLEVELISPSGTRSVLAEPRPFDSFANLTEWTFMSVQFWGEASFGTWRVVVRDRATGGVGSVSSLRLQVFGTARELDLPTVLGYSISGGNGNGMIDRNECNNLELALANPATEDITDVELTLSTTTPGVFIINPQITIPLIPAGGTVSNQASFQISTIPEFLCGTTIQFSVDVKANQKNRITPLAVPTGVVGMPVHFDNQIPVPIPDDLVAGTNSSILVSGVTGSVDRVVVALHLEHTFDSDLTLQLISPDGTTNLLATGVGGSGENFGLGCASDTLRTTFSDEAAVTIANGVAPFVGAYQPQEPLAIFKGKSDTEVNGEWRLRVVDGAAVDTGTLRCWSLTVYPVDCLDGGGQCPGADIALALHDQPDPVVTGSNLVYTITVTNFGPNTAAGAVVTHSLPGSVLFLSANTSMGSVSHSGGAVIANLGNMPLGATATITVTVRPLVAGSIVSSASVASLETELNPPNNTATALTTVMSPSSDLSVSLEGAPNPTTVSGPLTYIATVQNHGPSPASGVVVTNTLPASVLVSGASSTQGTVVISGNTVIALVGALPNGTTAAVTINAVPLAAGTIFATSRVVGNLPDPALVNNVSTVATTVGEAADLALRLVGQPESAVIGADVTYTVTVTNRGPNSATQVVVNQSLSALLTVSSSSVSQGSVALGGGAAVWTVGTVPAGASATMTLVGSSSTPGVLNSIATVNGAQADANTDNNTASLSTTVAAPFVSIVNAGASLIVESSTPANGAIDAGETVSIDFRLRNAGNVANTNNLIVTLLPGGGVTNQSGSVDYGILAPSGAAGSGLFSFTAAGTNGGRIEATLQVVEGAEVLTNIVFRYDLPRLYFFTNLTAITIPDAGAATPYPSTLAVSGVTGRVGQVTATLRNLSHTFAPDVDVLLVGPIGQKVVLMGGAGNPFGIANATVTLDDAAAQPLPQNSAILSSAYRPASYDGPPSFSAPAPAGPYAAGLSAFADLDPNGAWSLYVSDRGLGDSGMIASGWSLGIKVIDVVNQIADVATISTLAAGEGMVGSGQTWTVTVTNLGPATAHGVIVTNTGSPHLLITGVTVSQGVVSAQTTSQVVCSLGDLGANESAHVTMTVTPSSPGIASYTSSARALETDLNLANNLAVMTYTNALPVADLAVGLVVPEDSVVVGSNFTATVSVTNLGPGNSLNSTATLPAVPGLAFDSAILSVGTYQINGGNLTCSFGTMAPGAVAVANVTLHSTSSGGAMLGATASTGSTDTNPDNDSAGGMINSRNATSIMTAADAVLVSESIAPANGAIESGETVTVYLSLANQGELPTTSLQAVLLPTGGVQPDTTVQNYGAIAPGGSAARAFKFTAASTPGAVITATLQLSDNANPIGEVVFAFTLSASLSFTNAATIVIPNQGAAGPYPSIINVSGLTGVVANARITLNQVTHGFPADIDALLVGPLGQNVVLMSDSGGGWSISNVVLVLGDDAAAGLPGNAPLTSGLFKPTDAVAGESLPAPAPAAPYGDALASFDGMNPNGDWLLYVADDSVGDPGAIGGGWILSFSLLNPVNEVVPDGPFTLLAEYVAGENAFRITLTGQAGASYMLQSSGNLKDWTDVEFGTASANGVLKFSDIHPAGAGGTFYRAVRQTL